MTQFWLNFLPPEIRDAVGRWLSKEKPAKTGKTDLERFLQGKEDELRTALRARNADLHLVPNIIFHENQRHSEILQGIFHNDFFLSKIPNFLADMRVDFFLGEHLLLIGNQGVGKK